MNPAEIIKGLGRGDKAAQAAFAACVSTPLLQVIDQAPVLSTMFDGGYAVWYRRHENTTLKNRLAQLQAARDELHRLID